MENTRLLPATSGLFEAAELIQRGELVAFATETVYGLGADATNPDAVAKIYAAKGRPGGNPLIVHVPDIAAARACVAAFPAAAEKLAAAFWPGPLTLVLPRAAHIAPAVSAGRSTVAVRCPAHPVAQSLLRAVDRPIAAPSANRSGFTSPTTAQHVYAELAGRVALILDGGPCAVGLESTVLDLTTTPPTILRPGAITREMLEPIIGPVAVFAGHVNLQDAAASPGMHDRHYAPRTPAFRFEAGDFAAVKQSAQKMLAAGGLDARRANCVLLTHDPAIALPAPHETMLLPADAARYARTLYDSLRTADDRNAAAIYILTPPTGDGLWAAIHDRLTRATQPLRK